MLMPRNTRSSGDAPGIKALKRFFSTVWLPGSVTSVPDALLVHRETLERPFPYVVGDEGVEEQFPVTPVADPPVGMQHPEHGHPMLRSSAVSLLIGSTIPRDAGTSAGLPGAQNVFCIYRSREEPHG